MLGDDVDRGRLQLDDADVGVDGVELAFEPRPVGEALRCEDHVLEVVERSRPGREHGRPPAVQRLGRPQAQLEPKRTAAERFGGRGHLGAHRQDEIADQRPERVQPGVEIVRDEDADAAGDRRDRGSAAVEDDDVGAELRGQPGALEHRRRERRPCEPAAAATAPDRRHAREHRDLQVVRGGVATGARQRQEVVERRRSLDHLGLGRAPAAHRDDDDLPVASEQRGEVARHSGLADALARSDHRQRRQCERLERRRLEAEVGADVGDAGGQRPRCEREPLRRPEHRLVGQIDHDVGPVLGDRRLEVGAERHAVVLAAAQLLRAADEHGGDEVVGQLGERVADDRRVVLPVDHGNRPAQLRDESSPSIRAVYFSNSSVSVENWMIRSWPWNG